MNNNNLVDLMTQARNYEMHRKKVASIMTKNSATLDSKRMNSMNAYYSNKDRANKYNYKAKQDEVEKQNDLILKKIIHVNNRRPDILNHRNASHNNLVNMKKTMQTINNENRKFAQKLVSTASDLRQEKLGSSYRKHLERKQRITKYEYDQEVGMVIPKKIKSLHKLRGLDSFRYGQNSNVKERMYRSKISQQNSIDR